MTTSRAIRTPSRTRTATRAGSSRPLRSRGSGQTPDRFFAQTIFTWGHRNVVRAVASGLADSGSVDGYVYEVMRETEPSLIAATRVVTMSELLGFPPVAVRR